MTRNYSTREFFRQMPNALLARYFQGQGLFDGVDFAAMKEGRPDELFTAWLALPDKQRNVMDTEFRDIFEMSCEKGFRAIIDESNWQMQENQEALNSLIENLSSLANHYERVMVSYLDHKNLWRGATHFYHADTLSYLRKRKNLSHLSAAVDEDSIRQLEIMIRDYFHHTEG